MSKILQRFFSYESRLILYEIFSIEMKKKLLTIFFLMGLIAPAAIADFDKLLNLLIDKDSIFIFIYLKIVICTDA